LRWDRSPPNPWHVDWNIEDRYELLPAGRNVNLRYTDLTSKAEAGVAEGWVVAGSYNTNNQTWIPRALTRRQKQDNQEDLKSTFVALIDPYQQAPTVTTAARLAVRAPDGRILPESYVALSLVLSGGGRDLLVLSDPGSSKPVDVVVGSTVNLRTDAEAALVRFSSDGRLSYVAMARGSRLQCGELSVTKPENEDFHEQFLSP